MADRLTPYGKKLLSLAMIFNSLLSIVYAIGLLTGYYTHNWELYPPYLVSGELFWGLMAVSIINLFPSANIGQVKTGRLWFHHYVYGCVVSTIAIILTAVFSPIHVLNLFTMNTTNISVNIGRFFVLGGLTLIVDDLPDVSSMFRRGLGFLKLKAYQGRRLMHVIQYAVSIFCIYLLSAVVFSMVNNPAEATLANLIFSANLFVASMISLGIVKQKTWLKKTVSEFIQ